MNPSRALRRRISVRALTIKLLGLHSTELHKFWVPREGLTFFSPVKHRCDSVTPKITDDSHPCINSSRPCSLAVLSISVSLPNSDFVDGDWIFDGFVIHLEEL